MASSFADIIAAAAKSEATVLSEILAEAVALGLDVTNWAPDAVGYVMANILARMSTVQNAMALAIARSGSLVTARGDALSTLAEDPYQLPRRSGGQAIVKATVSSATGSYVLTAGQIVIIRLTDGVRWRSQNAGGESLTPATPLTMNFLAEQSGAAYNADLSDTIGVETALSGVVAVFANAGAGTPIVTAGFDEESDESLIRRCSTKWDTLSLMKTSLAIEHIARQYSPSVTKVYVDDSNPRGNATINVNVYGDGAPIGAGDIAVLQGVFDDLASPGCNSILVQNASEAFVDVIVTVYVATSGSVTSATVRDAVEAYVNSEPIGATLYRSKIIQAIQGVDGIVSVDSVGMELKLDGAQEPGDLAMSPTGIGVLSTFSINFAVA